MAKLGGIYIGIRAATDKLQRDFAKAKTLSGKASAAIQKHLDKINFKRMSVAAVASAAIVTVALKKVIDLAKEQEAVEKRLEAVLRSTGMAAGFNIQQMKDMASAMQEVTTTGDEVILSGMAMLSTFKQIRGEGFERTMMAALDLSEVMQQDLRSSIVMLGKALNDPVANLGALSRAGIQFTKTQKDMIKGLWKSGQQVKAQSILLKEIESQFGGAAKAARDTFGGAMQSASNAFGDMQENIGFAITKNEVLIDLVKQAEQAFIDAGEAIGVWVNANDKLISQKTHEAISKIKDSISDIIGLFNSLPEGIVGATGVGVVGRILTGSGGFGVFLTGMSLLNTQLKKFYNENDAAVAKLIQQNASLEEITAQINIGNGPTLFKIPARPVASPLPSPPPGPPPPPSPAMKDSKARISAMKKANEEMQRLFGTDFASDFSGMSGDEELERSAKSIEAAKDAAEARLEMVKNFNKEYNEIGKTRFEIEREQLEKTSEEYKKAGANRVKVDEWAAKKGTEISRTEQHAKLDLYKNIAGGVAGTFEMIAQSGAEQSKKAFKLFKAFAIVEATINVIQGVTKAIAQGGIWGVISGIAVAAAGAAQVSMIANSQPPSYDVGGVSNARGVYQTGNIMEAHVPIPSGKIPVELKGGGGGGTVVNINLTNPVFQDLATQRQTMTMIATVVATEVAPGAVVANYQNDGQIRQMVRGGV